MNDAARRLRGESCQNCAWMRVETVTLTGRTSYGRTDGSAAHYVPAFKLFCAPWDDEVPVQTTPDHWCLDWSAR